MTTDLTDEQRRAIINAIRSLEGLRKLLKDLLNKRA
jgi:hypothetical protein